MPHQPTDWKESWTLSDYIVYLVASQQTESSEFQTMLRIFGREKIECIWRAHRETIKRNRDSENNRSERKESLLQMTAAAVD